MTSFRHLLLGCIALATLHAAPACQGDARSSSSTNWLECRTDDDCAAVSGATCGPKRICVDEDGDPIAADTEIDTTTGGTGGDAAGEPGQAGAPEPSAGAGGAGAAPPANSAGEGGEAPAGGADAGAPNTGGSAVGGSTASSSVLISDCEMASPVDPAIHDGYGIDVAQGWEIAWFSYSDAADAMAQGKPTGQLTPPENQAFQCEEQTVPGGTSWVFSLRGGGFTTWGAGMGLNFKIGEPPDNVDLSAFTGIRFLVRVNDPATGPVRVTLIDQQATPTSDGGTCSGANGGCFNYFGFALSSLSTEWQEVTIPFSSFRQEPWSSEMFLSPQVTNVIGLRFQVGLTEFDFSVDDVELYR